ncbi:MAG: pyridoxal 5'-phosphate synthase glutaminase subunit PdxT [Chloroflexi bacterium]|nr:pyridoxal 5'-phosphate synthase glutaminase subunit PdxT [Chloroflexota bacterium]
MPTIGVLALQGDFAEHLAVLRTLDIDTREVRLPAELEGLDGLIIPGGESMTMAKLMDSYALREPIRARVREGMAVWGTCAGLILLAKELEDNRPEPLGLMDMDVARNAFGRQVDSFETDLSVAVLGNQPFHAVFIRAPIIKQLRNGIQELASLPDGHVVAARQERMLATAFHPELTDDARFHEYFLSMVNS